MASVSEAEQPSSALMRSGLRIQRRVIGALMMRELHTRYGRENIGYLWLILEPMLLAAMIGLLHSRGANHYGSDIKPVPMALVGYCNFMTFRSIINRSEGSLEGSSALFYHRTVSVLDLLVSRALLESAGTFLAMTILMGLAVATGVASPPERPLMFLLGVVLMTWFSFNLSMIIACVTHERRSVGRLVHPITYIMMPLSGAFFILHALPSQVRDMMLVIPLAHIFELLRYGWFRSATPEYIDPIYLTIWIGGTMLLGLLLISTVRKRIHLA